MVHWKDGWKHGQPGQPLISCLLQQNNRVCHAIKINQEPDQQGGYQLPAAHVIWKRESIILKVKTKYWQETHKSRIETPRVLLKLEAKWIDKENEHGSGDR